MNRKYTALNLDKIGILLLSIYVFFSFTAHDIVIPLKIVSFALYAFLVWGVLVVFMKRNAEIGVHTMWYFAFMCWSFITAFYSPEFKLLDGSFRLMIVALVTSFFFQLYVNNEERFVLVAWLFCFSSFVLVGILYFTGNLVIDAGNRLGEEVLGNANAFAGMLMYAVMFEMWLIVYKRYNVLLKGCLLLMIMADYYALTLSGGRLAFVVPMVFLYILLLCKQDDRGRRHTIRYTLYIVVLIAIIFQMMMTVDVFYDTLGYRMESLINGTMGIEKQGTSAEIRAKMRTLAIENWMEKPILGYGFDSFKYLAQRELNHFFYSHCNFTELLYNGGIVSFLLYYWIYFKLLNLIYKAKNVSIKYKAFAISVALSFLVYDYGIVTYNVAYVQIILAIAFKCLEFKKN